MIQHSISRLVSQTPRLARLSFALLFLAFCLTGFRGDGFAFANPRRELPKPVGLQTAADVTMLELGKPLERQLSGGQQQRYQLSFAEGQYASVTIEQRGIDIVARLLGADGKQLAEFDSEIRLQGSEQVEWVAETGGSYWLSVAAKQQETPDANYVICFNELRVAVEIDRALQEGRKLYAESVSVRRAGKYDAALPLAQRALEIYEKWLGAEYPEVATSLNNLAEIHRLKGDYLKAEPLHQRALAIRMKVLGPDHPHVAYSLNNLAILAETRGDYRKSKLLSQRALEIKEKSQGAEHPDVATSLHNFASLYLNTGDYNKAEQLLQRALKIKEKASGPDHPSLATTLNNLALIYRNRGDYGKAEQLHQRALEIREKGLGPEHPDVASSLNNLASVYHYQGDYDKAEQLHQRALEVRVKALGPDHPLVATVLNNLAEICELKGEYTKAESMHRRALEIRSKALGAQHRDVGSSLNNLARLEQRKGNYTEAESMYRRALEIREKVLGPDHPHIIDTLNDLAGLYTAKGDFDQAIASQLRANTLTERNIALNLEVGSDRQKLAYLHSLSRITDRTLSLHTRTAPDNSQARLLAITTILQRKGRVLDAMGEGLARLRRQFNPQDQALFDQLADATAYLAKLVLSESPQRGTLVEHQKEIKALAERREELEDELSRRSAGFYQQKKPVTLEAIRAAIPSQVALLEFAVYRPFDPKAPNDDPTFGAPRYAAYVVRNQGEVGWKDLGDAKAIDDAIEELRQALRDPKRRDTEPLARAVDEKIMQPLRPLLGDAKRLLISPDGALNLVPFEALLDEQNRYLVERFSCTYLTSGRDLLRLQVARPSKTSPLVLANPLFGEPELLALAKPETPRLQGAAFGRRPGKPQRETTGADLSKVYFTPLDGTDKEAQTIKSLFAEASVWTGTQATESLLKKVAAPRLIHIATHGFFLTDMAQASNTGGMKTRAINAGVKIENPLLRSGLALAGANLHKNSDDDGILTALEATGLNLWGTKLVTLSACDTGVGEVKNGEGVYGLRRAFILAGTETLVMSLWPVSDYVTRQMMTAYYKGLKQGQGRGEALRQVQLAILKQKGREHPFYWASFIQAGEWANLDGKR